MIYQDHGYNYTIIQAGIKKTERLIKRVLHFLVKIG